MISPHEQVYTRLGLSKIHGIGVFAIKKIPKDTNIFSNDIMEVYWFDKKEIDKLNLDPEIKKLYSDFCIIKDGKYGTPVNFNSITPGWYINEPVDDDEGNVYPDSNYNFFAKRDIEKGEELTVRYSLFSEHFKRY
jgi:SET domain-containing protein